ncbi:hypothetical protein NPIL_288951 [Nephila pilipes]|uniref:Uncharacterized protein n=1 Tax=Nephila pilipes TaxID=299642 RepID=A0A8X6Q674_NEPPI|nr:hypothetical protein NPIL_288951 [Nephila pilipes]
MVLNRELSVPQVPPRTEDTSPPPPLDHPSEIKGRTSPMKTLGLRNPLPAMGRSKAILAWYVNCPNQRLPAGLALSAGHSCVLLFLCQKK